MNFQKLFRDLKPHILVISIFLVVCRAYFYPTFNGLTHREDDVTQGLLKGTELSKYEDKDGNFPGWTNSIFSGMPSTMIKGKVSHNQFRYYNYLTPFNKTEYPFRILLLSFIGFYMLMCAYGVKPQYGVLASLAYGFATYSISSVEAAHYTKVLAMGLMPAVLASMHWLFSGRYYAGGITLAFNLGLQVYFFHYQITYYTVICMLIMGIYYLYRLIQEKKTTQLILATVITIVASLAGVATNISKLISTKNFAEHTMRGGNDMAKADESYNQKETGRDGLKRDYAFDWSYGKAETFTLLIPNFYGGSSSEKLDKSSRFYEVTQSEEALEQGLPMYHGELTFTSGPIYVGAIIIFLFVLGMIILRDPVKWPLLAITLVSFILGWGKHFAIINDFLFDNLPFYNKFRTPMMAFCIAQVSIPLVGFLGLKQLYEDWKVKQTGKGAKKETLSLTGDSWKMTTYAYFAVGGFCLLMATIGPGFMDLGGVVDEQLRQGGNSNLIPVLKEDRASLLRKDAFRSFIYITLAFGLMWAWYNNKVKKHLAVTLIGILAAVDLIGVDWRYLSWDDFQHEKGTLTDIPKDQADEAILSDPDPHYRVFDLTRDPFQSNDGAAWHKMIGGYDPAKLSRYQDMIAEILSKREYSEKGLDMLNCKYMIGRDSGNRRGVIPRPTANGNAWFVSKLEAAQNAAREMDKLKTADHKTAATFDLSFPANKGMEEKTLSVDSSASVKLLSYHPDTLVYKASNAAEGYLVFSEIWYDNWRAEIDGKQVPVNKVNYTLRGISVPAGSHDIKLYFTKGDSTTDSIEKTLSLIILAGLVLLALLWLKGYFKAKEA